MLLLFWLSSISCNHIYSHLFMIIINVPFNYLEKVQNKEPELATNMAIYACIYIYIY